jgi:nickel transport protein
MRNKYVSGIVVIYSACMLAAAPGHIEAHDLWLERNEEGLILCYGHMGDGQDGVARIEYPPEHVLSVICLDSRGNSLEPDIDLSYPVRICCGCAVTCVLTSSGYWTKTPFGTKNLPKDEAKSPLRSWLSYESVKRIDVWNEKLMKPFAAGLELTPINNPLLLEKGDKVRLLITYNGDPAKDVPVAYGEKTRGQSDKDGRVNIRLKRGGMQLITASLKVPDDGIKADEIVHTATLIFEIGGSK